MSLEKKIFEENSGMIFVDKEQYLSDDVINIIEKMFEHHIAENYSDVRNIILGYNSHSKEWRSKYGQILQKKICDYVVPIDPFFNSTQSNGFVKNKGMIFYNDEIYENTRIYMDDVVKRILDLFFTLSKDVIDYRYIIDIIITEWTFKNKVTLSKIETNLQVYGSLHYLPIEIREKTWKEFKNICRYREVVLRDGFKHAILTFLEDRAEMLKG